MRITFLGTGAAEGIPALFCNCAYCRAARRRGGKEIRGRAQVLYGDDLCVDFPPDVFSHAAKWDVDLSAVRYLLVTHSHFDHFCAQNLILRGYKYAREMTSPALDVYGNEEVCEIFHEDTRRELRPEIGASIGVHPVRAFEPFAFGKWRAHPIAAQHSSRDPLLYLLEGEGKRILHLTDTGGLPQASLDYLAALGGAPLDLVVLDCTFLFHETLPGSRHMGLDADKELLESLEGMGLVNGNTKRVITHFSHNCEPSKEATSRAEEEYGVIAAYDGMRLDI